MFNLILIYKINKLKKRLETIKNSTRLDQNTKLCISLINKIFMFSNLLKQNKKEIENMITRLEVNKYLTPNDKISLIFIVEKGIR